MQMCEWENVRIIENEGSDRATLLIFEMNIYPWANENKML